MKEVRKSFPNARLVVAGTGPALSTLKQEMPNEIYLDWLSRENLARAYAASDVMLFPSQFDTFGNVVVESLACGTPVISYGVKGPKDIIEHEKCGLLAQNFHEFTQATLRFLGEPLLKKRLESGCLDRVKTYAVDRIVRETLISLDFMEDDSQSPPNQKSPLSSVS